MFNNSNEVLPLEANSIAVSLPIPEFAPVMTTYWPFSDTSLQQKPPARYFLSNIITIRLNDETNGLSVRNIKFVAKTEINNYKKLKNLHMSIYNWLAHGVYHTDQIYKYVD